MDEYLRAEVGNRREITSSMVDRADKRRQGFMAVVFMKNPVAGGDEIGQWVLKRYYSSLP